MPMTAQHDMVEGSQRKVYECHACWFRYPTPKLSRLLLDNLHLGPALQVLLLPNPLTIDCHTDPALIVAKLDTTLARLSLAG
jgi:hypothetical protein